MVLFILGEREVEEFVLCEQRSHFNHIHNLHSILHISGGGRGEMCLLFSIKFNFFTELKIFESLNSLEV